MSGLLSLVSLSPYHAGSSGRGMGVATVFFLLWREKREMSLARESWTVRVRRLGIVLCHPGVAAAEPGSPPSTEAAPRHICG